MSTSVEIYGAVPQKVGGTEMVSLTGSASILNMGGKKILVDLGLFQGGEASDLYNKENISFFNDIDVVVITHSHIDHIGRLPILYKLGYRGPIYMTSINKDLTRIMLKDSLKIQEGAILERMAKNSKLGLRLRESLKIKECILGINDRIFSDKESLYKVNNFLDTKLNNDYSRDEVLDLISDYLDFYGVENEEDIEACIKKLSEPDFSSEDIAGLMTLITTVEIGEEKNISNHLVSSSHNNHKDQHILDNLPKLISEGFDGEVSVNNKHEKRNLVQKWQEDLEKEIKKSIEKLNGKFQEQKVSFQKKLETALTFCEENDYLDGDKYKNLPENKKTIKKLRNYRKFLKLHGVIKRDDITKIINDNEKLVDIFKIGISFNSEDIKNATKKLQIVKNNKKERDFIKFVFGDSAHIPGSVNVTFNSEIKGVKDKVSSILDKVCISVFFSGDMGRMKENILGRPQIPSEPSDYIQLDTTYGGRNHRNREESVRDFINSIKESEGNDLIGGFSNERIPKECLILLEEIINDKDFGCDLIFVDAPLGKKVIDTYLKHNLEPYKLLQDSKIDNNGNIIYSEQSFLFGRQVIKFLGLSEYQEIYEDKTKKHIIIASSGMMDGGAIMNHLPYILQDEKATILAPGYLCKGTIGYDIVIGKSSQVTVGGEKYPVKCNSKFIDGFSAHIGHDEILDYITETLKELNSIPKCNFLEIMKREIL